MADPIVLCGPYPTRDDAAIAGFGKVLKGGLAWKTNEFAFWVVLKPKPGSAADYFYTLPKSDGSGGEVTSELPRNQIVVAHGHTHPAKVSTGDFSPGDKRQYVKVRNARPGVAWYLLNPKGEIRLAEAESDFPAGKTVSPRGSGKP